MFYNEVQRRVCMSFFEHYHRKALSNRDYYQKCFCTNFKVTPVLHLQPLRKGSMSTVSVKSCNLEYITWVLHENQAFTKMTLYPARQTVLSFPTHFIEKTKGKYSNSQLLHLRQICTAMYSKSVSRTTLWDTLQLFEKIWTFPVILLTIKKFTVLSRL